MLRAAARQPFTLLRHASGRHPSQQRGGSVWRGRGLPSGGGDFTEFPVTVVVPVFNALPEVQQCLSALLENTDPRHTLMVVNDASTDAAVAPALQHLAAAEPRISLLENPTNQGYTRTINRAAAACDGDVVLLNSDTRVTAGWLGRLQQAAYSRSDAATATPLSNAAGAFSVPYSNRANPLPVGLREQDVADLIALLTPAELPLAPTGNGFCMYIKREVINAVGLFDANTFPRGYGEENDFAMRARKAGYVHVVDDRTYVFHHRSASFGAEKAKLLEAGQRRLARLHPEYPRLVKDWLRSGPLAELRQALATVLDYRDRGCVNVDQGLLRERLRVLCIERGDDPCATEQCRELVSQLPEQPFDVLSLEVFAEMWCLVRSDTRGKRMTLRAWHYSEPLWSIANVGAKRARTLVTAVASYGIDIVAIPQQSIQGSTIQTLMGHMGITVIGISGATPRSQRTLYSES
mgnify:CR=1 FL=1